MKTSPWSLLIPVLFIALTTVPGCGEPKPKSMAEDISLSDIQAYEAAQKAMEAESMGEMKESPKP